MTGNPPRYEPDDEPSYNYDNDPTNICGRYILKYRKPVPCIPLFKWAHWMEKSHRRVRRTQINNTNISTVFLGLDHSFSRDEDKTPITFETMIFTDGDSEEYQTMCATWREALAMHWEAVSIVRSRNG